MTTGLLEKENIGLKISDEQKILFEEALMERVLGKNPTMTEEVSFADKYGAVLSNIIMDNEFIKSLIIKDSRSNEAIDEVIRILDIK